MSCTPEVLLQYSNTVKRLSRQLAQFCMFTLKASKVLGRWISSLVYYRPHLCPGLTWRSESLLLLLTWTCLSLSGTNPYWREGFVVRKDRSMPTCRAMARARPRGTSAMQVLQEGCHNTYSIQPGGCVRARSRCCCLDTGSAGPWWQLVGVWKAGRSTTVGWSGRGMLPNLLVTALPAFLVRQQALRMMQGEARKLHSLQANSNLLSAVCEGYFRETVFQRSIVEGQDFLGSSG